MPEYARKADVSYGNGYLEMYQLPNGKIKPSLSQASATLEKHHDSFKEWALGKSPEALEYRKLIVEEVIKENRILNPENSDYITNLSDAEILNLGIQTINFGDGCLIVKLIDIEGLILYWTYWATKKNELAQALLASNTKETIMRRANHAFGIEKTELEYQQQTNKDFHYFKEVFATFLNPLMTRMEQMDNNIKALTPYIEKGKVADTVYKMFPNYEILMRDIAYSLDTEDNLDLRYVSQWSFEMGFRDLSRGEIITVGREVSAFSNFGKQDGLSFTPNGKGRKKYPEAFKPVIKDAILKAISRRNVYRLVK